MVWVGLPTEMMQDIVCMQIPISQLLDSSKAIRDIIDRGELVPDELVVSATVGR